MSGSIDIIGPAGIARLDGTRLVSLGSLVPGGISITDTNNAAAITVTLAASAAAISLSASSAGGGSIGNNAGTLTITGTETEVNAALASLALASTAALGGVLSMNVGDSQGATKSTTFGLTGYADPPIAFVAPPGTMSAALDALSPVPGLVLAAGGAEALGLVGAAPELMNVTLISSDGALLLDPAAVPGLAISGDGTGTLVLGFASPALASVNAALASVDLLAGGNGTLEYIARQLSGPLTGSVTSGSLSDTSTGTVTPSSAAWRGGAGQNGSGSWQSAPSWSGGVAPGGATAVTISGNAAIGGIGAAGAISLAAGASLALGADVAATGALSATGATLDVIGSSTAPAALSAASASISASTMIADDGAVSIAGLFNAGTRSNLLIGTQGTLQAGTLMLGGGDSLLDFGSLAGGAVDLGAGSEAFLPGGGVLGQSMSLAGGAIIDFAGLLEGGATAAAANPLGLTLAAGAIIEGAGTLVSGNFSESGVIDGPGTILALGPVPLTIAAGSIGGGAHFIVDPGAVLELGAVSPLYGVFNATPLTIGASATISFAPGANSTQDYGLYPSGRGEQGGVLLLDYPGQFAGTIDGFAPGDRIAIPSLANLSLSNLTGHSFMVSGTDANGVTQSDMIHASYASGLSPFVETDTGGDTLIGLRAATAQLTLNDVPAIQATIDAVTGYREPIYGLGILLPTAATAALALTISAVTGLITDSAAAPTSTITLTGATGLDLNHLLGELAYAPQGGGSGDTLRFTGAGGALNGFTAAVAVSITAPATLAYQGGAQGLFSNGAAWSGGNAPANGDVTAFASHAGAAAIVNGSGEASAFEIAGAYDFTGTLDGVGQNGPALTVDAGGNALFDANAQVILNSALAVGDSGGAGTAGVAGFLSATSITIAGTANAAGSMLDVSGSLSATGSLDLGGTAAGTLDLSGALDTSTLTIGGLGIMQAAGAASITSAMVDIKGGTLALSGAAISSGTLAMVNGGALVLNDSARFVAVQSLGATAGTVSISAAALLEATTISMGPGAALDLRGTINGEMMDLAGMSSLESGSLVTLGSTATVAGVVNLAGGTLVASAVTVAAGAVVQGSGVIGGRLSLPAINIAGAVTASGGTLTLGGDVTGNVTIGASAALDLVHGASGGTISFTGANETLIINDVGAMQDTVSGMVAGDAIDLVGVPAASVSIAGGVVSIADPSSFGFTPAASQPAPQVAGNSGGGSTITMGGEMPCFARGTMLLTPTGYRPVESLAPGDPLVTGAGQSRGIVWIGSRVIDLAADPAAHLLRPVIIAAGAFGKSLPLRPLRLSPLHAVYAGGGLIPAALLVNGATITRDERVQAVTYYHVELTRHDVVRAEGLAVETYRDTGNRHRFAEARGIAGGPVAAFAPLVTSGPALARTRRILHERVFALGYRMNHAMDVTFQADGAPVMPRLRGRRVHLTLPGGAGALRILSRGGAPAETDPLNEDRRHLGVCIGGISIDGKPFTRTGTAGWHQRAVHDQGCWTRGDAVLPLPPEAVRVSLDILGTVPVWMAPR